MLLGIFPILAKKLLDWLKGRKVYAKWAHLKPKAFDRNLVVIGAGSAGLVTAYIAAAVKGEGDADRKAQDGRRLPQHRLRAVQGADQVGQAAVADEARRAIRPAARQRRGDFADVMQRVQARRERGRAARFDRALHRAGRRMPDRQREDRLALGRGVHAADGSNRRSPPKHRHRVGRAAFVPPIPASMPRRLPDQRHRLEPARAAQTLGGAGRRPDRQRADAVLRALRRPGVAGGDAAAHPDP